MQGRPLMSLGKPARNSCKRYQTSTPIALNVADVCRIDQFYNSILMFSPSLNTSYPSITASSGRRVVPEAMRAIESVTCLRFRQRTNQQYYLRFFRGQGCYSYVGNIRKQGGQQVSLLSPESPYLTTKA